VPWTNLVWAHSSAPRSLHKILAGNPALLHGIEVEARKASLSAAAS
jgi:hypothetical protein